jgi:hypothetical protein
MDYLLGAHDEKSALLALELNGLTVVIQVIKTPKLKAMGAIMTSVAEWEECKTLMSQPGRQSDAAHWTRCDVHNVGSYETAAVHGDEIMMYRVT